MIKIYKDFNDELYNEFIKHQREQLLNAMNISFWHEILIPNEPKEDKETNECKEV